MPEPSYFASARRRPATPEPPRSGSRATTPTRPSSGCSYNGSPPDKPELHRRPRISTPSSTWSGALRCTTPPRVQSPFTPLSEPLQDTLRSLPCSSRQPEALPAKPDNNPKSRISDPLLVRRLPPFHANVRKRLVKSPEVCVRDSGIVHTLLRLDDAESVLGHPVAGASWEGFAIEALLRAAPERTRASFYRTAAGAESDLLLELPDNRTWAVESVRAPAPAVGRGFRAVLADLNPDRAFLVPGGSDDGDDRYPKWKRSDCGPWPKSWRAEPRRGRRGRLRPITSCRCTVPARADGRARPPRLGPVPG